MRTTRSFGYDASGRLSKVEAIRDGEKARINYLTNALGQRVFKSEVKGLGAVSLNDGVDMIGLLTFELGKDNDELFIHGDPAGLRRLSKLLDKLAATADLLHTERRKKLQEDM